MKMILAIATVLLATPAASQALPEQCKSLGGMIQTLSDQYGEVMTFRGWSDKHEKMTVLFVAKDLTWTLVTTDGDMACVTDFGADPVMTALGMPS